MSRVFMLKPADGIEGVKNAVLTAVKDAGPKCMSADGSRCRRGWNF